eukprot:COSAG03_NODE_4952_length_1380_cov_1.728337_1_plen_259_part_01
MPSKRTREAPLPIEDTPATSAAAAVRLPVEKRRRGGSRHTGLDATLERVLAASDWRALFFVGPEGASDSSSVENAARAVRNRLVQVVHPDHVPLEQRLRATQAAQHLNMLWDQARHHFNGGAAGDPGSQGSSAPADGDSLTADAAADPGMRLLIGTSGVPVQPGGSLDLLMREVREHRLLECPAITPLTYVGFAATETLGLCRFLPMATNRCISQDVVAQRVNENLARLRERNSYANFGQISVVAVTSENWPASRWPDK